MQYKQLLSVLAITLLVVLPAVFALPKGVLKPFSIQAAADCSYAGLQNTTTQLSNDINALDQATSFDDLNNKMMSFAQKLNSGAFSDCTSYAQQFIATTTGNMIEKDSQICFNDPSETQSSPVIASDPCCNTSLAMCCMPRDVTIPNQDLFTGTNDNAISSTCRTPTQVKATILALWDFMQTSNDKKVGCDAVMKTQITSAVSLVKAPMECYASMFGSGGPKTCTTDRDCLTNCVRGKCVAPTQDQMGPLFVTCLAKKLDAESVRLLRRMWSMTGQTSQQDFVNRFVSEFVKPTCAGNSTLTTKAACEASRVCNDPSKTVAQCTSGNICLINIGGFSIPVDFPQNICQGGGVCSTQDPSMAPTSQANCSSTHSCSGMCTAPCTQASCTAGGFCTDSTKTTAADCQASKTCQYDSDGLPTMQKLSDAECTKCQGTMMSDNTWTAYSWDQGMWLNTTWAALALVPVNTWTTAVDFDSLGRMMDTVMSTRFSAAMKRYMYCQFNPILQALNRITCDCTTGKESRTCFSGPVVADMGTVRMFAGIASTVRVGNAVIGSTTGSVSASSDASDVTVGRVSSATVATGSRHLLAVSVSVRNSASQAIGMTVGDGIRVTLGNSSSINLCLTRDSSISVNTKTYPTVDFGRADSASSSIIVAQGSTVKVNGLQFCSDVRSSGVYYPAYRTSNMLPPPTTKSAGLMSSVASPIVALLLAVLISLVLMF